MATSGKSGYFGIEPHKMSKHCFFLKYQNSIANYIEKGQFLRYQVVKNIFFSIVLRILRTNVKNRKNEKMSGKSGNVI